MATRHSRIVPDTALVSDNLQRYKKDGNFDAFAPNIVLSVACDVRAAGGIRG